jgi:hypothetical protein
MNGQITKDNYKLVETKEVSFDHPDTIITIDGQQYTLSFKNVKINIYKESDEDDAV